MRDTREKNNLLEAKQILESGMKQFDDALPLGEELVLVLRELDKPDEAVKLLKQLEVDFPHLNDEILCRWGSFLQEGRRKVHH